MIRCRRVTLTLGTLELFALFGSSQSGIVAIASGARFFLLIFQINHISNGARTPRLLTFNLISRAELSNGDVEASSASPEQSPPVIRVEVGSGISDGEWLCCVRQ
jgi:hypothetical protein